MGQKLISRTEFIALMAMLTATVAFSIDAMLPALDDIGRALSPDDLNLAQLVITSFVFGLGVGTFVVGPLSDTFGRKNIVIAGAAIYIVGALLAWIAPTLELMIAARILQGIGAAAPRIVGLAIVRDLYEGREMARILSFIMLIFSLIPAFAPAIGAVLMGILGWRGIFPIFVVFILIVLAWMMLRLPESLPRDARRPLRAPALTLALKEVFTHRSVRLSVMVQTLCFAMLFTALITTHSVYDVTFDREAQFPLWFALTAVCAASASLINAALVVRLGMQKMVRITLMVQICISGVMVMASMTDILPPLAYFALYVVWVTSVFFLAGMTIGNLNAIAMEPLGHIAGMAASAIGAVSTVGSVLIAIPIGQLFDGTPTYVAMGVLACATLAYLLMLRLRAVDENIVSTKA
ncbi:multidrug effflux MFS transporter [Pseudaestuariivita rosea]|uniref:multidrug effflux MFS transporter n=1 Tax=Pseudaestuariivita rosea TaxID=2763263 RepID=UPI001ABBBCA6|nr:multidrug effflux MFS transporter [Pseudaestuariivita rosea]